MKILFASSEVAPFAKVGGLADVSAALPRALARKGHDIRIVMPLYHRIDEGKYRMEPRLPPHELQLAGRRFVFTTHEGRLPDSEVPVYFIDCPALFGRPGIYTEDGDEHVRFALLNWAALRVAQRLPFRPDIVHANDWQTALLPLMIRTLSTWDLFFRSTKTVLTIHNIGHQGTFPASTLPELGLQEVAEHFHQDYLKEGKLSFMATGISFAHVITTVSPTYAGEIQTPQHGVGLDGFLRNRKGALRGILNGIDDTEWNPARDPHLPFPYSHDDLSGKAKNRAHLCQQVGLPYEPHKPLIGLVSRLTWQKGFDLCFEALPALLEQHDVQFVALGSGEHKYEELFRGLAQRRPYQVSFANGFSEPLAHLIEAGSDMFLMPSRYEPCGLNQMYSLGYGTVPIVHKTGGLADTVRLWNPATGEGNGFVFDHFSVPGLKWALGAALTAFADKRQWRRLMMNGMTERFGWQWRVREYENVYRAVLGAPPLPEPSRG